MSDTLICPACGMHHTDLGVTTRLIPWSDDCACSDHGPCVYHQQSPPEGVGMRPRPTRPSEEVMIARAQAASELAHEKWLVMAARFRVVQDFMPTMEAQRRLLERTEVALWEIAESEGLSHADLKLHDEIKAHLKAHP